MQPMAIIPLLELAVEPRALEPSIHGGKTGQDACEQFLDAEGRGGGERVEGDGGGCVGGVDADADYGEVFGGGVVRVDEDAADFQVALACFVGGIECV